MLQRCVLLHCKPSSSTSTIDALFRRALGAQSTVLDLVPVKKPLLDGWLSWPITDQVEIILVAGVRGTSPDAVTETVRRRAVCLLSACGDGDALRGCQAIRRRVEEAVSLRRLLVQLDLHIRLVLQNTHPNTGGIAHPSREEKGKEEDAMGELRCAIYTTDAWEPDRQQRHLCDITSSYSSSSSSPQQPVDEVVHNALRIALGTAKEKQRQLLVESIKETQLLVAAPKRDFLGSDARCEVDFSFSCLDTDEVGGASSVLTGSWTVRDEFENTERDHVALAPIRDAQGLVHHRLVTEQASVEGIAKSLSLRPCHAEDVAKHVLPVVGAFWRQPLMHALLLSASEETAKGRVVPVRAEDYIGSCGRAVLDDWLTTIGRVGAVPPPLPLFINRHHWGKFLHTALRLELGSRAATRVEAGPIQFDFYFAQTASGKVATPLGGFVSPMAALNALLPWHTAMPAAPPFYRSLMHTAQSNSSSFSLSTLLPPSSSSSSVVSPSNGGDGEEKNTMLPISSKGKVSHSPTPTGVDVRVLDLEETLRRMGITSGSLKESKVTYFDSTGAKRLEFEQMNSIFGIERLVRKLRREKSATFVTIHISNEVRPPRNVWARVFSEVGISKAPPYMKNVRVPVPLLPEEHFNLRTTSLYQRSMREYEMLRIMQQYSEEPAQWPLRRLSPCFFNEWKLTRANIYAIITHDKKFRYTVECCTSTSTQEDDKDSSHSMEEAQDLVLRFFSGEERVKETVLRASTVLADAYKSFSDYAKEVGSSPASLKDLAFPHTVIQSSFSVSYKVLTSSLLHGSHTLVQRNDKAMLQVQLTTDVYIILASGKDGPTGKEPLCELFIKTQFPSLIPTLHICARAAALTHLGKNRTFRCLDVHKGNHLFRWEYRENDDVIQSMEGESKLDVFHDLVQRVEQSVGSISSGPVSPSGAMQVNHLKQVNVSKCKNTILAYQVALAKKLAVDTVRHEYNAHSHTLVLWGVTSDSPDKVIRAFRLSKEQNVMTVLHPCYRLELNLPEVPGMRTYKELSVLSVESLYGFCQPFFGMPLPSLKEVLTVEKQKFTWFGEIQLPASLFGIDELGTLKLYGFASGKNEARRRAVWILYKSLFEEADPQLRRSMESEVDPKIITQGMKKEATPPVAGLKKGQNVLPTSPLISRKAGNATSMVTFLEELIVSSLREHVEYDGVVECRLSHLMGITGRYVRRDLLPPTQSVTTNTNSEAEEDSVIIFCKPLDSKILTPLQILAAYVNSAHRLNSEETVRDALRRVASSWPSLFLSAKQNERLFCTTCLRRYLGLWTYEDNDVDETRVSVPGTMYLVERTRRVDNFFMASLSIMQTPIPPNTAVFVKAIASYRGMTQEKAIEGMWSDVAHHFSRLQAMQEQEDADFTILDLATQVASGTMS